MSTRVIQPAAGPRIARIAAGAAFCSTTLSIAASEIFLAVGLAAWIAALAPGGRRLRLPQVFWFWLLWAALEILSWLRSPDLPAGLGEIRHLLLVAALFLLLPALESVDFRWRVWRALAIASAPGSAWLVAVFAARLVRYRHVLAAGGDPAYYLRSGGLLHHWMIYATVEATLFGGLLELRAADRASRRWTTPLLLLHVAAILLSLTRSLWLACLLVAALHLALRRSPSLRALPVLPVLAFLIAPVRHRAAGSLAPGYYSNAERLQMWRVGWKMLRGAPWTGVGPGRVEALYPAYLPPGQTLPAYHGHLHNNAIQLAAQFGLPAALAACVCLAVLIAALVRRYRHTADARHRVLCRAGLLGLAGFLFVGLTDYTYGHSLGLILAMFVAVSPLVPSARHRARTAPRSPHLFTRHPDCLSQTHEVIDSSNHGNFGDARACRSGTER